MIVCACDVASFISLCHGSDFEKVETSLFSC